MDQIAMPPMQVAAPASSSLGDARVSTSATLLFFVFPCHGQVGRSFNAFAYRL